MKRSKSGVAIRLIIGATVLLIAYTVFGNIIINQAKSALMSDIRNRMLDVAKMAAASLDGNALDSINRQGTKSPSYPIILNELSSFQSSIDLKYIYIISKKSENEFVFSVDPSEPEVFGTKVLYNEAMYQASLGTPSITPEPYEDPWGRFYSGYAPVYDSHGVLSGIVVVDYEAEKFENQVSHLTFSMMNNGMLSLLVGIALVTIVSTYIYRRLRDINKDLALLGDDIETLTTQLSVPGNTDNETPEAADYSFFGDESDEVVKLGSRISGMRKDIEKYIEHSNARSESMINALAKDYRALYYANLEEDFVICYRSHAFIASSGKLKEGEKYSYKEMFERYAQLYVDKEYKESFVDFIQPENIKSKLEKDPVISLLYISTHFGKESYEMIRIASANDKAEDEDGIISAVSIGITDVDTETRKTLEQKEALLNALDGAREANKAKTAFLSNMSHEIRTPMNAIISLDSIALADPDISDKTRDYLAKIGVSSKHLLKIINDILDMSRIEAGRVRIKSEEFSMAELLEQVNTIVESQCQDKGLQYKNQTDEELKGWYIGDALKLKQVLINILGNAVKYTEPGGTVSLFAEKVISFNNRTTMRFIVKDTGIGMDPEFLPRVFEAFSQEDTTATSKYNSTGLGMAITKNIVEMMNGEIGVESEKMKGTTFTVTLTFMESGKKSEGTGKINASDLCVLIVSDNIVSSKYLTIELGEVGMSVDVAESEPEAVEKVRVREARNRYYNLVVVDREMINEDFNAVITGIRKVSTFNDLVIALMAYSFSDITNDIKEADVDVLLSKPVTSSVLMDKYKAAIISPVSEKKDIDFTGRHILLAEDKEINAEIMTMVLETKDVEVDVAENGQIAVDKYSEKKPGYYSAILMDMRMPEMDGITATGVIRKMGRPDSGTIPIIALTANAFDEDVERSLQAGLNAHLTKPVEPELLFDTLRRLIKE